MHLGVRPLIQERALGLVTAVAAALGAVAMINHPGRGHVDAIRARPAQASSQPPATTPGQVRVSGRLIDRDSGAPIASAKVTISGCDGFSAQGISDRDGWYAMAISASSLARSAGFTVSAYASGYLEEAHSWDAIYWQHDRGVDFALFSTSGPQPTPTTHSHPSFSVRVEGEVPDGPPLPLEGARFVNEHCKCYEYPILETGPDGNAITSVIDASMACGAIRYRVSAQGYETLEGVEPSGPPWHGSFVLKRNSTPSYLFLPRLYPEH